MTGLLFALLGTLIVGLGGRDQMLVAQLSARQGARPAVLLVALASAVATSAIAAWSGTQVAGAMTGNARLFLVALALGLAGLELLVLAPRTAAAEPTHSLGAFALVVFAIQLTDAARFLVFAVAAFTRAPWPAGAGGAVGAALLVVAGWTWLGGRLPGSLRTLRRCLGAGLVLLALGVGARAAGFV